MNALYPTFIYILINTTVETKTTGITEQEELESFIIYI